MNDQSNTITDLKQLVRHFVNERNWQSFHTPKNLASSLAIETAELMEHFQWLTGDESLEVKRDAEKCGEVADEMADCLAYLLALANVMEIDLSHALAEKMKKNARKYPPPG